MTTDVKSAPAEGMPKMNRRQALAGIAFISAGGSATEALANAEQEDVAAAARRYIAALAAYQAWIAKESDVSAKLEEFEVVPWAASCDRPVDRWFLSDCNLRSTESAKVVFQKKREQIVTQFAFDPAKNDAGWRQHWEDQTRKYLALADVYEAEALAYLAEQEARYDAAQTDLGYDEVVASTDAAQDECAAARDVLLDLPCQSLADVQAKASAILSGGKDGSFTMGDMGHEEVARLLASFGGRSA